MASTAPVHGLSRDVTLAVLPRLYIEELVAELARRNISFGGYSFKRESLVVMLKDVMTQEYRNLEPETYPSDDVSDDRNAEFMPDAEPTGREQFQGQILQKYSQTLSRICPSRNIENSPWPEPGTRGYDEKDTITKTESRSKYNSVSSEAYPDTNDSYNNSMTSANIVEDQTAMGSTSECRETDTSPITRLIPQLGDFFSPKTEIEDDKTQDDELLYSINPAFQSGNTSNSPTPEFTTMLNPMPLPELATMLDSGSEDQQGDHIITEPVLQNSEHVSAHCNDEECVDGNGENSIYETEIDINKTRNDDELDSSVFHNDMKTSRQNESSTCLEPQDIMLYACKECDYRTKINRNFVRHTMTHTAEKPFMCTYCDYRTARRDSLKTHMYRHVGEKPFKCSECEYRTVHKSYLVEHVRKHTGEKPYKCDECGFKAAAKSHLVEHMRKHTGEKPFMCGECGFRAAHKARMNYHMKKHTGDKPHVCNICGYRTIQKAYLVIHQRKHTGEKPFVCGDCGFKSAYQGALINHMKRHTTDGIPLSCDQCGFVTTSNSKLVRHKRVHHGDEERGTIGND